MEYIYPAQRDDKTPPGQFQHTATEIYEYVSYSCGNKPDLPMYDPRRYCPYYDVMSHPQFRWRAEKRESSETDAVVESRENQPQKLLTPPPAEQLAARGKSHGKTIAVDNQF